MSNYKELDVVKTTSEYGEREFIIIEVFKHSYKAIARDNRKKYVLEESVISCKIGMADIDDPALEIEDFDQKKFSDFCEMNAEKYPEEKNKWQFLKSLTPGAKLNLVHRNTVFPARFINLNYRKPIYPLKAEINGKIFDFKLDSIFLN